jgi:hypothetical protein
LFRNEREFGPEFEAFTVKSLGKVAVVGREFTFRYLIVFDIADTSEVL